MRRPPFALSIMLASCGGKVPPFAGPTTVAAPSSSRATGAPSPPPVSAPSPAMAAPKALAYPETPRSDVVDDLHGTRVADPYRWLEDGQNPRVKEWAVAEDKVARDYLASLPGRDAIADRLKELLYVESTGVPRHYGNRWFFARRDAGSEKPIVYFRDGRAGADKVLLDPNTWSSDGTVSLGEWSVSWDGRRVAYAVKGNNSDEATLHVIDVENGKISDIDIIEGAKYAFASWTPAGDGFYYTWLPPPGVVPVSERPGYAEVRFHKLGSDPKKDRVIHERTGDPTTFIGVELSKDGRWLILSTQHGWSRTDVRVMDMHAKARVWMPLTVGRDALYRVQVDRNRFFIYTNEGAARYRVFRVDATALQRDAWKEIVPERTEATLTGVAIVGHQVALTYLKDVVGQAELRDQEGTLVRAIELPTLGSIGGISGETDDDLVYYAFQSFTYPTEIFETNVKDGSTHSWYRLKVPVDPDRYGVSQLFATSKDGTRVPFFVVRGKNLPQDGATPTILYGYGGFQAAMTPSFSASIYPWLEQGGMWVVANLRGGSEYGEEWHRHGMRHLKQNVFDDYVAVADELIRRRFTKPEKLAARGGSNGGLLVGAAITQRPELFRVALCGVPLLDMVRYHRFGSGKTWVEEYGSADNGSDFATLFAYSPYHHIRAGTRYPATLLLSADSDDRVDPMHARKFAAALQWGSRGGPVLLRVETHSGHGGADLVKQNVAKIADEYAFALAQMKN